MRAILVDDENLAVTYLKRLLTKLGTVETIGIYTNPNEAIVAVLQDEPDVVFLDIQMPGMSGIELVEEIQQSLPETKIVFVTAFNEYAAKAFDLNAVDYLLKPLQYERLKETINRLSKEMKMQPSIASTRSPMVCAFQTLSFTWDDNPSKLLDVRWRTSKVRGVFAYLLQHRGSVVRKDTLSELFWPDIDWEKGFMQLYSAIYQVRKTIASVDSDIVITNHEDGYKLDLNGVKFDVDEWENGLNANQVVTRENLAQHQKLLALYQGDYLAKEDYIWAESERERLLVIQLQHIITVAKFFEEEGQYSEAISLYLRMQMAQPHVDYSYFKLLQMYGKINDISAVERQYEKLKEMSRKEYGIEPRPVIQDWYETWLQNRSNHLFENT